MSYICNFFLAEYQFKKMKLTLKVSKHFLFFKHNFVLVQKIQNFKIQNI